jgi:hypothetical protein
MVMVMVKRKSNFTEPCTKRIKFNTFDTTFSCNFDKTFSKSLNKRKNNEDTTTNRLKKIKIDDTNVIQETILLIECGMCSRKMLNQCKDRYLNYIKSKEMLEFLNLMKCKKTIEDEMNLYRLVYKIEKSLLNF